MKWLFKISIDENKSLYQNLFTPTLHLNFLLKFCENNLLVIEIISFKFYEKKSSGPLNELNWKSLEWVNGEEPNPQSGQVVKEYSNITIATN